MVEAFLHAMAPTLGMRSGVLPRMSIFPKYEAWNLVISPRFSPSIARGNNVKEIQQRIDRRHSAVYHELTFVGCKLMEQRKLMGHHQGHGSCRSFGQLPR